MLPQLDIKEEIIGENSAPVIPYVLLVGGQRLGTVGKSAHTIENFLLP